MRRWGAPKRREGRLQARAENLMCGFAGALGDGQVKSEALDSMAAALRHRGPDEQDVWWDSAAGIGLAHTRLSILDLSQAGHQPMQSPCGRLVLAYNGEIYNHAELRTDLERENGHFDWRGYSDTETLLAGLRHWGVEGVLQRCNGMFAFALWDRQEHTLYLARDRLGEKPLYYGVSGDTFLFGSELKGLRVHPAWRGEIDRDALTVYLRHSYVPSPRSIYKDIAKLPPAHYLTVREKGRVISTPRCYWDFHGIAQRGVSEAAGDPDELVADLDALLRDSVRRRMVADVPLGAFLSGGFDSSTIVALMQAQSERPVRTFSIGFYESDYNEADRANAVAAHLGTDHTELYLSPGEAMAVIPRLPQVWDEPFSDPSQIPSLLVSELARRYVTVSLSGDGGDELFCGYNRYLLGYEAWKKVRWLPSPLRKLLANILSAASSAPLDQAMRFIPIEGRIPQLKSQLGKLSDVITDTSGDSYYRQLVSHWNSPEDVVIEGREVEMPCVQSGVWSSFSDLRDKMMYLDSVTYLPDDILTKMDRASMAVSLEARVPLLDHRVVEFAWKVPNSFKYRDGKGKWLLRQVLNRYVPSELVERPKMGFGVPLDQWLRGPLRDWAEALLNESSLREEGYLNPTPIRAKWLEHVAGKRNWGHHLWVVLMFEAWLKLESQAT